MIEKMAELVRDKRIEGISDIRDESDRQGYRVVIELKRDANRRRHPQPALPLHAAADLVRRQHCRAERRQAGSADAARHAARLRRLPRGGHQPPHEVPAAQGARPRPRVGRSGHRRRQYRRSDPADPPGARSADGARAVDDAPLAGAGRRIADPADRRSASPHQRGRHLQPVRRAGPRDPRTAPCPPHGARPRRDRRRAEHDRRGDCRLSRHPVLARAHPATSSRTELAAVRDEFGTPRRTELASRRRRHGRRGPDPARGHGRHGHPCRLHQARAAVGLSGAESRRQGPLGHDDQGRGFRHAALRRQHAHADPVLLLARHRLQGKGLAPADRHAAVARQGAASTCCRSRPATGSPRSCRCRTSRNGMAAM